MARHYGTHRNRKPGPLPAVGTPRADLDLTQIVMATFHPRRDEWWLVWHSPPALVTVVDKKVAKVEECPDGRAAVARFDALTQENPP
jgi:hypothetical protein